MLHHELLEDKGVLVLTPEGPLTVEDFKTVAAEIDPYMATHGGLNGLVIDAARFPGWHGWDAFTAHVSIIRSHERRISRAAVVTDSTLLKMAPELIGHFLHPEVRCFAHDQRDAAIAWVGGGCLPAE